MPRVLAIDYGKKRCGIAISDPLKIIANPYTVLSAESILHELKKIVIEKEIDTIVVGYPVSMKSEKTSTTQTVEYFIKSLKKEIPGVIVEKFDERLTSKMAQQILIFTQTKKSERQKKSNIDLIAATILLQNYLDYQQLKQNNL
jgi:putative Holliday junction resolvase